MQDSHPSLYSTKTLYHLCISDVDRFISISLEYSENYMDKYQGKMFLNIENVLVS